MKNQILLVLSLAFIFGCSKEKSKTTGWNYNDPKHGGFEVSTNYTEQVTPDGMAFIEGGSFTMGRVEQDVQYDWNNVPKTVTVSSFYMDETEVRNIDYLEYLFWIERVYGSSYENGTYPEIYWKALPDTNVWRDKLSFNEPYVESYLRHPAFNQYPVVGVSWEQAIDYCAWRTDRVNERILIDNGYLWEARSNDDAVDDNVFKTDAYKLGKYEGRIRRQLPNLKLSYDGHSFKKAGKDKNSVRIVQERDGILLPRFRLPTEAEWEFAALSLVGNTEQENVSERKLYPWNGDGVRNPSKRNKGEIVANFKRGRGDNMGTAGRLNDNADKTAPVISYWPNEYGLYNMAGNVSEWVMDIYRPLVDPNTTDINPFRGNVFETWERDEDRYIVEKDTLGNIIKREVNVEENLNRRNYSTSDNINYLDGDYDSRIQAPASDWQNVNGTDKRGFIDPIANKQKQINEVLKKKDEKGQLSRDDISNLRELQDELKQLTSTNQVYELNETSLISDQTRVYKGGSYKDRAYWMVPGTRRFLDQKQSTSFIGFRCAMDRLGPPTSNLKENRRKPVDWNKNNGYYDKK